MLDLPLWGGFDANTMACATLCIACMHNFMYTLSSLVFFIYILSSLGLQAPMQTKWDNLNAFHQMRGLNFNAHMPSCCSVNTTHLKHIC